MATALESPTLTPTAGNRDQIPASALNMVRPPLTARRASRVLFVLFALAVVAMVFVPWQQFLSAHGKVTAFDPTLREQVVEAPVTGRIIKVHVVEGQEVRGRKLDKDGNPLPGQEGTLLVSIRDPDPELMKRMRGQLEALRTKLKAAENQVDSLTSQIASLKKSREQGLKIAAKEIEINQQKNEAAKKILEVAKASYEFADYQYKQQQKLLKDGLTSELEFQKATREILAAKAERNRAEFSLLESKLAVLKAQEHLDKIGHDFDASIRSAKASKEKAEAEVASNRIAITDLEVSISRQGTQDVHAPCDGTVFRVLATGAGGGMIVQAGTPLMRIVPDVPEEQRAVELMVDGNDAPLILEMWQEQIRETGKKPEIKVRLQFEGYPAIQWVGWPSAAVGTFGGVVDFVDQTDDGKGNFRILVRRDPEEEKSNPWPSGYALRQGLRVNGWVLLNQVPLGWEMWRRLNGFPPVVAETHPDKEKSSKPVLLKGVKAK